MSNLDVLSPSIQSDNSSEFDQSSSKVQLKDISDQPPNDLEIHKGIFLRIIQEVQREIMVIYFSFHFIRLHVTIHLLTICGSNNSKTSIAEEKSTV
jgi:hypothetical protein